MGPLLAFLSTLAWAAMNVYVKRGIRSSGDSSEGLWVTICLNVVTLATATALFAFMGRLPAVNVRGLAYFIAAGVLTTFLGRYTLFRALHYMGPSKAIPFKAASPIVTMTLAGIFLGETITFGLVLGALLVFAALVIVSGEISSEADREKAPRTGGLTPGHVLVIASGASFGTGHFFRKMGLTEIPSPWIGALIGTIVAGTCQSLLAWRQGYLRRLLATPLFPPRTDYLVAGILSALALVTQFAALNVSPASVVSLILSTEPVVLLLMTALFFRQDERLTFRLAAGGAAVCLGVTLVLTF